LSVISLFIDKLNKYLKKKKICGPSVPHVFFSEINVQKLTINSSLQLCAALLLLPGFLKYSEASLWPVGLRSENVVLPSKL